MVKPYFLLSKLIKIKLNQVITLQFNQIINNKKLSIKIEFNRNKGLICYKSFICLELAKLSQLDSLNIAQDIADVFNQLNPDISTQVSRNGWLEFTISDLLLCDWLKKLPLIRFPQLPTQQIKQDLSFNLYYTHARFCSILKSAHQQQIITLNNPQFKLNQWQIENYQEIPYGALPLRESYEYQLIKELVIITELINNKNQKINYFNILNNLSKVMLEFESYCRIWGKVKKKNIQLSQARLGLMALALFYYQNLFYGQFERELPQEF